MLQVKLKEKRNFIEFEILSCFAFTLVQQQNSDQEKKSFLSFYFLKVLQDLREKNKTAIHLKDILWVSGIKRLK